MNTPNNNRTSNSGIYKLNTGKQDDVICARRKLLLYELFKIGVYKSSDGRMLDECSLFTLEWIHAAEKYKRLNR